MPCGLSHGPRCWISWRRQTLFWMTFRSEWLFGNEKTIFPKVNSPFHLSAVYIGLKYVYIDIYKVHFITFRFSLFCVTMSFQQYISETKDPLWSQPHLKESFEGIARFTFNNERKITHMESAENEKVECLLRVIPASAKGLVEKWFREVNIFSCYLGFCNYTIIFSFRSHEFKRV